MRITLDKSVDINGLTAEINFAVFMAIRCAETLGAYDFRITSMIREPQEAFTYHQDGRAVDFKVTWLPGNQLLDSNLNDMLLKTLKNGLDSQYDIVYHQDSDGVGSHFHIESDKH